MQMCLIAQTASLVVNLMLIQPYSSALTYFQVESLTNVSAFCVLATKLDAISWQYWEHNISLRL
jgi:hypothetical protein